MLMPLDDVAVAVWADVMEKVRPFDAFERMLVDRIDGIRSREPETAYYLMGYPMMRRVSDRSFLVAVNSYVAVLSEMYADKAVACSMIGSQPVSLIVPARARFWSSVRPFVAAIRAEALRLGRWDETCELLAGRVDDARGLSEVADARGDEQGAADVVFQAHLAVLMLEVAVVRNRRARATMAAILDCALTGAILDCARPGSPFHDEVGHVLLDR